jgi:transcriptional regulator with XRE-family HTH domain
MVKKAGPKVGSRYKASHPFGFGRKLFELRSGKGLTQAELAEKMGVSVRTASYYERRAKNPTMQFLERIAIALEVPVRVFLEEEATGAVPQPSHIIKALKVRLPKLGNLSRRDQESLAAIIDGFLGKKSID